MARQVIVQMQKATATSETRKERKKRRKDRREQRERDAQALAEAKAPPPPMLAVREPRAQRETTHDVEMQSLSVLQRFSVLQVESNPYIYLPLQVAAAFVELAACVLYFLAMDFPPEGYRDAGHITITSYPFQENYVHGFGVLGIVFCAQYVLYLLVSDNRAGFILSADTLIFLITAPLMIVMAVQQNASQKVPTRTIWAPIFLRSWSAWKATAKMIRHFNFSSAVKEITVESAFLVAILVSSAGVYQASEMMDNNKLLSFDATIYMVLVTISTMGYGEDDVIPTSRYSFVTIIVIIFVAMIYLPVMLNKFSELAEYLSRRNTYGKTLPHVVVVGNFAASEVKLLFGEFMAGPRKFTPLNLVLVSPEKFEPGIITLIAEPAYRSRVTLCVSNSLDNDELIRFRSRQASALFIMSSRSAIAERGDYDALIKSIGFSRHDRDLPQYLTLKRGAHIKIAKRTAQMVFEREKMKFSVMGMAMQLPGFIPMLFNLIKTFEKPTGRRVKNPIRKTKTAEGATSKRNRGTRLAEDRGETGGGGDGSSQEEEEPNPDVAEEKANQGWFEEYQSGMMNSLFTVACPETFIGRQFKSAGLILLLRVEMTMLGIIKEGDTTTTLAPQGNYQLKAQDKLIVISRATDAEHRMQILSETEGPESGRSRGLPPTHGKGALGGEVDETAIAPLVPGTELIRIAKGIRKKSAFPFEDHVLLIDLSCFQSQVPLCAEEELNQVEFQKQDLLHLLQPFFADRTQQIVWLSRDDVGDPLEEAWPKHMRPMYHVRGAGTNPEMLELCNVAAAKAVLIFTSLEGDNAAGDASLMLVQRMVHDRLREAGREKETPVLIEVDDYGCLNHCKPRYLSDVAADNNVDAEEYFTAPVYVVGGAISSAMLDTLMYQTYYNPWIPTVVDLLLYNPSHDKKVTSIAVPEILPQLLANPGELYYSELFRSLVNGSRVPLGLYRRIESEEMGANLEGFAYFVTNPQPETVLRVSDFVYVIQGQDS